MIGSNEDYQVKDCAKNNEQNITNSILKLKAYNQDEMVMIQKMMNFLKEDPNSILIKL